MRDVAASVRARLLEVAHARGRTFDSVLRLYGIERFLYRLSVSDYRDLFVLKGGVLLIASHAAIGRTTADIDLLGLGDRDLDAVLPMIQAICALGHEDGIVFDPHSVRGEPIEAQTDAGGIRVRFTGALGSARIPMQLDIAFGDALVPRPRHVTLPSLLDQPPPRLKAYSLEGVIAEKFHAMVDLGGVNSRMKDFYDVWLLSTSTGFKGQALARALCETFRRRGTTFDRSPGVLSAGFADEDKQKQWRAFLTRHGVTGCPEAFADVLSRLARLLAPVYESLRRGTLWRGSWDPQAGAWRRRRRRPEP